MAADKVIHFGAFVRRKRVEKKMTLKKFAFAAGITETRVNAIEKMEKPVVYDTTRQGIANALGFESLEAFDDAWQNTPVTPLIRKPDRERAKSEDDPIALARARENFWTQFRLLMQTVKESGMTPEQALKFLQDADARDMKIDKAKAIRGVQTGKQIADQHASGFKEAASHSKAAADAIERKKKNRGK